MRIVVLNVYIKKPFSRELCHFFSETSLAYLDIGYIFAMDFTGCVLCASHLTLFSDRLWRVLFSHWHIVGTSSDTLRPAFIECIDCVICVWMWRMCANSLLHNWRKSSFHFLQIISYELYLYFQIYLENLNIPQYSHPPTRPHYNLPKYLERKCHECVIIMEG